MKKAMSILCLLSLLLACKVKNTNTGALKTNEIEKLLAKQWVVKSFTIPVTLQNDSSLYTTLEGIKGKRVIFNDNHTFSFYLPNSNGMGDEKGTWVVKSDGKVIVTDSKNKVTEFSTETLRQKKFTIEIPTEEGKGTEMFLQFVPYIE